MPGGGVPVWRVRRTRCDRGPVQCGSGGQFTPLASFYQWSNSHRVGSVAVDYNQIINERELGAIWPEGSDPNPVPSPGPDTTHEATHAPKPSTPAPPIVVPPGTITVTDSRTGATMEITTDDLAKIVHDQVARFFMTDEDQPQPRGIVAHLKRWVKDNPYGPDTK